MDWPAMHEAYADQARRPLAEWGWRRNGARPTPRSGVAFGSGSAGYSLRPSLALDGRRQDASATGGAALVGARTEDGMHADAGRGVGFFYAGF